MKGGEREEIEGWFGEYLKRRIKDFDKHFPSPKGELKRVQRWLWVYSWAYQIDHDGLIPGDS